jgi:hypothetical protein
MINNSTHKKLQDLLNELDELLKTGVVTKDEYDCLSFILHHVYDDDISNQCKQELSFISNFNYN